ncbi:hypothetical protein Hanom_Chr10g00956291 [Helianthus anomalus]
MVKDNKGIEKHSPMHKNKAIGQQFLHYSKLSTGRVQPTRPRAEHPAENAQFRYLDTGPCSLNTPPCPAFCLLLVLAVWTWGRAQPTPPRVQLPSNIKSCF